MDGVDSSEGDLDLDVDLESGNGTSEEDVSVCHNASCKNLKKSYRDGGGCSCSCSKLLVSDKGKRNNGDKIMGKGKRNSEKPSKPPRPPKGPALDASDMKLLKELSELNLKRKKMEKIRTLRRMKKDKGSSTSGNLIAFLVTIVFFMVIIFQGLVGSRV